MIDILAGVLVVIWAILFVLMVRANRRRDQSWKNLVEFVNREMEKE